VVGEFRMVLRKVNGSLGFTLQSTDETVLKHTVKVGNYCAVLCRNFVTII
jgi:hypothetical protein